MTNVLIIGNGQIGDSLHNLYNGLNKKYNIYIKDIEEGKDIPKDIDVLHICYGYSKSFIEDTILYLETYKPSITMIHSTTPLKTTKAISSSTPYNVVHTPVIGCHPNLTESLVTFVKMVGGYNDEAIETACNHLVDIGITPVIYNSPEETEAAKMLSTTYYGWNIMFMKEVKRYCEENYLDFENVYEATNHLYNEGYKALGINNVKRPVLKYMSGKIGGHCVRPNMELLKDSFYPAKIGIELDDKEMGSD